MPDRHPAHLAHQFEHEEQQRQSSTLGMWIFLITEVMFFGGLFCGYTIYRVQYPDAWAQASHLLSISWGALNTVVLIVSSFTMAMAVRSAQIGRRHQIVGFLLATMALGLVFLGVKVIEYADKIQHHLVPNANFHVDSPLAPQMQLFFSFYFTMTGMHAIHMIVGEGILAVMVLFALRGRFSEDYYNPVEVSGLYWHFVDVIWIFLFALLYLVGRHVPA